MNKTKISFIGVGNMAGAIIKGIYSSQNSNDIEIYAYDIDENKITELKNFNVIKKTIEQIAQQSDYIFLSVKPQHIHQVLEELKPNINRQTVLVSIAAGISDEYIKKQLEYDAKIVLVMPNTPLLLGYGATALSKISPTNCSEFDFVVSIFKSSGIAFEIPSDKMKEIIPINGSAPAFIYLFTKGFIEYASSVGIDEKTALELFCGTLIGSAKMMTSSGYDIDQLIAQVSSKGGTTIAGLEEFDKNDFTNIIQKSCKKCTARAYELSK